MRCSKCGRALEECDYVCPDCGTIVPRDGVTLCSHGDEEESHLVSRQEPPPQREEPPRQPPAIPPQTSEAETEEPVQANAPVKTHLLGGLLMFMLANPLAILVLIYGVRALTHNSQNAYEQALLDSKTARFWLLVCYITSGLFLFFCCFSA